MRFFHYLIALYKISDNDASSNDIGFVVQLFEKSAVEKDALGAGKSPEDPDWEVYLRFESPTIECNTETFNKDNDDFSGGSIWTIMPTVTGSECRVAVEKGKLRKKKSNSIKKKIKFSNKNSNKYLEIKKNLTNQKKIRTNFIQILILTS